MGAQHLVGRLLLARVPSRVVVNVREIVAQAGVQVCIAGCGAACLLAGLIWRVGLRWRSTLAGRADSARWPSFGTAISLAGNGLAHLRSRCCGH